MGSPLPPLIQRLLQPPQDEGQGKVLPLEEAISRFVRPGMTLYLGESAGAAARQVLRQFSGTRPAFTLVAGLPGGHATNLIHAGLVKKLIFAVSGSGGRRPSPSRVIQRAFRAGTTELENWSLLTFYLRLMAGAMGLPFLPTRSLLRSSLAQDNADSFLEMEDPFGSGERVGLVRALNPDLALLHAWAADGQGNALLCPSSGTGYLGGAWGAPASREGVALTVERIVPTDFLREHAHFVSIPGYLVKSISLAPFGAHPQGLFGYRLFPGYAEDYDFLDDLHRAQRDPPALDSWIKEWALGCPRHQDYLDKLGQGRLERLQARAGESARPEEMEARLKEMDASPYSPTEMMAIASARLIAQKVRDAGYRTILAGGGVSSVSAWVAYYRLKEEGSPAELVMGSGWLGYVPRPGSGGMVSLAHLASCKALADVGQAYGVWVGGATSRCLSVLGAGQVDKFGNINSTKLSPQDYLVGIGGANDAVNAREVVLVAQQSRGRFLEQVPYISAPGRRVSALVSTLGVFQKLGGEDTFTLTHYLPTPGPESREERLQAIRENCGWELRVASDLAPVPPPSPEELALLRLLDLEGFFLGR